MVGDDFRFDIAGAPLKDSLAIASLAQKHVTGWSVESAPDKNIKRLVLFWRASGAATNFITPVATNGDAVLEMVTGWLKSTDYNNEPDLDGSVDKGSRVYNEQWGFVGGNHSAFVAIEPHWLTFGK